MKLTYLHQYFVFPEGSGGTRSFDLARSFVNMGYQVDVITSSGFIKNHEFKKGWNKIEREGLTIHVLNLDYSNELSYLQRMLVFIKFLWFSTFKLLSIKCDVVLATSTPLTIGIPALIKKWWHNTPFIFETRDVWPEAVIAIGAIKSKLFQKALFFLEKTIYKNAAAIVPLSVDMKHSIVSRYPKTATKKPVEVIENIAELNRFQSGYDPEISLIKKNIGFKPQFSVVYAGTFGRVNGIDYVVNLAEKILALDESIVFILIGDGALKADVIALAKERQLFNKNIFVLYSVSKQELPQWYYEASMGSSFVIPIKVLWANSANKFFDTLAAGKPVLINHPGWQKETIEGHNVGYVLPEELTDQAIKDFVAYTQDAALQQQQRENALQLAKTSYALDVAVNKYDKLLKGIINSNKTPVV